MTSHLFKPLKLLFLAFILSTSFSCLSTKLNPSTNTENEEQKSTENMIISIIMNVHKSSIKDKDSLTLYEISVADGFLKKDIEPVPKHIPGKWMLSFLNADHELIKNTLIDDPLIAEHEYLSGEGDDAKLEHVEMQLEKATLTVRARYSSDMKFILMEKTNPAGNPAVTKLFKINQ
ncbi:hypothetical protein [Flavivirga eckloniae]|uniref:Uncharacterized protein n=1 Tax=Flavivirga eckloniae TaxID=1803846 RepID=A0A2K9PTR3_9FLAO|nr:hypothetical protein [Flavivirga eckloniae]AUP80460.1 hypothetical protein C1H87_17765 [Flavivirga eckloniae]